MWLRRVPHAEPGWLEQSRGLTETGQHCERPPPHTRAQPGEETQLTRKATHRLELCTGRGAGVWKPMGPSDDAARMSGQLSKPKRETEGEGTRGCKGLRLEKM